MENTHSKEYLANEMATDIIMIIQAHPNMEHNELFKLIEQHIKDYWFDAENSAFFIFI